MTLVEYRTKRNFKKTPEPTAKASRDRRNGLEFVIQKHAASHLHYDFRLELDGVLKSWAVPKGPSTDPQRKALAVRVEDHPFAYRTFEGTIPKGNYGAGTVEIWDRGTWTPIGDPHDGLENGKLHFQLHGDCLSGEWALVRLHKDGVADDKNWLLMKIREGKYAGKTNGKQARTAKSAVPGKSSDANSDLAGRIDSFERILPQLATWTPTPPSGDQWLHEVKLDGYRLICYVENGTARLITRGDQDWTHRYPHVARDLAALKVENAIFDGEIVVMDEKGRSHFQLLQNLGDRKTNLQPLIYLFDLLQLNSEDLRRKKLIDRKKWLERVLKGSTDRSFLRYSDHSESDGAAVVEAACKMALEGIISKRMDSPYTSGRTKTWLKSKCQHRQELVIIGYTDPQGARADLGALLLGYYDPSGQLLYAGRVGTGFNAETLKNLKKKLTPHAIAAAPTATNPPARERRYAHWVRPQMVAEIKFTGWTSNGMVRHGVFRGLREDKAATAVVREDRMPTLSGKTADTNNVAAKPTTVTVKLTHPEKVLFPEADLTKADLAKYYDLVAERMLPHVSNRPLSLVRCPSGRGKSCFFQKHFTDGLPEAVQKIDVSENKKPEMHVMINNAAGLTSLVQIGTLEIHTWGSTAAQIEKPDRLIFDLDPDPKMPWSEVKKAAVDLRKMLGSLGFHPLLKTTGGKGLHVVLFIEQNIDWPEAKPFCKRLSEEFAATNPEKYTTNMRFAKRDGKILIDYLRNGRGATAVAPYSIRARENAPISLPIEWEQLSRLKSPNQHTVNNIAAWLKRNKADPWAKAEANRVDVPKVLGL